MCNVPCFFLSSSIVYACSVDVVHPHGIWKWKTVCIPCTYNLMTLHTKRYTCVFSLNAKRVTATLVLRYFLRGVATACLYSDVVRNWN